MLGQVSEISAFDGLYAWLSNFSPCRVEYEGDVYRSVEHAYQAAKTNDPLLKAMIRLASPAAEATRLGRRVPLCSSDWDRRRHHIMLTCLRSKFSYVGFAQRLLATRDAILIESNTWNDTYWGVCNGQGENWLGRLLTQVRTEVRYCVAERWLAEIQKKKSRLNDWELGFIGSIRNLILGFQCSGIDRMTWMQFERLESIYAERT